MRSAAPMLPADLSAQVSDGTFIHVGITTPQSQNMVLFYILLCLHHRCHVFFSFCLHKWLRLNVSAAVPDGCPASTRLITSSVIMEISSFLVITCRF